MKKRMTAGMLALVLLIFPLCTGLVVWRSHTLMMERERTRALSEEAAIAHALSKEIGDREYSCIQEIGQSMQQRYGSDSLHLSFVYHGMPMNGNVLPQQIRGLLKTDGRATLLLKATQTLYIAHVLRDGLILLVQSDVSPIYAMTQSLLIWSVLLMLIGIVFSFCAASLISAVVLKPVEALLKAVQKLENGQYDAPLPECEKDEIGALSRAFEKMSETVQSREQLLKEEAQQRQNLLDALAHEMRTPLTTLIAGTDMLQCARLTQVQQDELTQTMGREARRLSCMEERLLLLTNLSHTTPEFKQQDLRVLMQEAVSIFDGVQLEGEGGTILCEKELMIELIRNLIVNAKRSESTTPIRVIIHEHGFTVKDTGCGMTEEQQLHAFDPFFKADASRSRKQGGAGLGLTLCKKIADLHGAALSIESAVGQGTSMTFMQKVTTL